MAGFVFGLPDVSTIKSLYLRQETLTSNRKMKQLYSTFFYLIVFTFLLACDSDDESSSPTTIELITAKSWRVDTYDVQASSGGQSIPESLVAPFVEQILEEVPLNGIITFEAETFSVEDQATTLEGTWSLSDDETEITMVLALSSQTYTFQIKQITSENFDMLYVTVSNIPTPTGVLSVDLEVTAFLVEA